MSNESVIEVLCKNNANVNIQNKKLWSPLHEAIKNEKEDLVEILVEHGADLNLKTKDF